MRLLYLSHGAEETGGYFHEKQFSQSLANSLGADLDEVRYRRHFSGLWQWGRLAVKAWRDARSADTIVTVARLSWPVWWRIRFGKARLLLVLHNFDPQDGKPALYHRLLRLFLQRVARRHPERVAIVVVGRYWQEYFQRVFGVSAFLFPNFFPEEPYLRIRLAAVKEPKTIHLGQWSNKVDKAACAQLIGLLEPHGFACYFSSPVPVQSAGFPVRFFDTHEAYLQAMANGRATVILNRVAEGWSRVAHESVLCGTVLLARPLGGIAELMEHAGAVAVNDAEAVLSVLLANDLPLHAAPERLKGFDLDQTGTYLQPIVSWLK
jgi:hypothetical protein